MNAHIVEDKDMPLNTLYIINPRYKTVQVNKGEPPVLEEVLDMEATARVSAVITNIGTERE